MSHTAFCNTQHFKKKGTSSTSAIPFSVRLGQRTRVSELLQEDHLFVLEVNPRASRTLPFLSKALHLPLIKMAVQIVMGTPLASIRQAYPIATPQYFFIKQPIFSFDKFYGVNRNLGLEMKSTGEAIAIGRNFEEALQKSRAYTHTNMDESLSECCVYSLQEMNRHLA